MSNPIKTQKIRQGNQEFFMGVFTMEQVRQFTRFTSRLLTSFDENGFPVYNDQVQRKVRLSKVNEIAEFLINDEKATFPTNIVIGIPEEVIDELQEDNGNWIIHINDRVQNEISNPNGNVYLTIIDGQHRIAGIEQAIKVLKDEISLLERYFRDTDDRSRELEYKEKQALLKKILGFELMVTFFKSPTLEYQAMIFSTINRTQTKVPINLVYNLFGLSSNPSPQKTALEVSLGLNAAKSSPFYARLKLAGATYKRGESPPLSQATMVRHILLMICPSIRQSEIERHKTRKYLKQNWHHNLPFRKFYAEDNDKMILLIMSAYFSAVRDTFKDDDGESLWELTNPNKNILHTTVGFDALMDLLRNILQRRSEDGDITSKEYYMDFLILARDLDIIDQNDPKKYPFAAQGRRLFYDDLVAKIF